MIMLFAFICGIVTVAATLAIPKLLKSDSNIMLVLSGIVIGGVTGSAMGIIKYVADPLSELPQITYWTMGSLGDITYSELRFIAPIILLGIALAVSTIKPLNILLLGESYAVTSGVHLTAVRRTIFISTTLLAGTITAFCGHIGFVGIATPHIARIVFRSADHKTLIPASAIFGAIMLLIGDIISKMLTLPINTVTALMGIPVVVYIVTRNRNLMQ